jgi:hypothetical protein
MRQSPTLRPVKRTSFGLRSVTTGNVHFTQVQAIKLIDPEGRSCVYVPITQNGKVVDSQGFILDPEDE